jgi:hypothetical protein
MKRRALLLAAAFSAAGSVAVAQGVVRIPALPKPPVAEAPAARAPLRPVPSLAVGSNGSGYSICHEANFAIDEALMESSYLKARGIGDDSAPRATMRAAEVTAQVASAQANLSLLIASDCPLPDLPISASVYEGAAIDCVLARTEDDVKAKCNRTAWGPGPRWLAAKRTHE